MNKAKYVGKYYGNYYNRDTVFLEYEYRGHRYEVYENKTKGNEPLRWQHANAQGKIDREIELEKLEEKNKHINKDYMSFADSLDYFFEMINE
jgi:hypothetical protein